MMSRKKRVSRRYRASVLVISMIFVLIFSALAVNMASISGTNVQIASNQHNMNAALAAAHSGQEVMRYWLSEVRILSSTPKSDYLSTIVAALQKDLSDNGISNITVQNDGSVLTVMLNSTEVRSFGGQIEVVEGDPMILRCHVMGYSHTVSRIITVEYVIRAYEFPIFNYGLATKGPLHFLGNPNINGLNFNSEADIFVESNNSDIAMLVTGNSQFDGDISVGNSNADVDLMGSVQIGDDKGQTAIDNHVHIGAESPEFPIPITQQFQEYATGPVIDSFTDLSSLGTTITNATIAARTDPNFEKSIIIEGILYIERPNVVTFEDNVTLKGLIVADGDPNFAGPDNSISFLGNFSSTPVPSGAEFDAIREEKGSSILTPAFSVTLAGNFSALSGVMAVSGAHFSGNVSATAKGTIIDYSNTPTVIEGNASLRFDRSDNIKVPAGFDLYRELEYDPSTYSEAGV
jgi:hypothetical protein